MTPAKGVGVYKAREGSNPSFCAMIYPLLTQGINHISTILQKTICFSAVKIAPSFVAFLANIFPLFAAESASSDTILPR